MAFLTPRRNTAAAHLLEPEAIEGAEMRVLLIAERIPTSLMNEGWVAEVAGNKSGRSGRMAVEDRAREPWAAGSGTRHSAPADAGSGRDMSTSCG